MWHSTRVQGGTELAISRKWPRNNARATMKLLDDACKTLPVAFFFTVQSTADNQLWAMAAHGAYEPFVSVKGFLEEPSDAALAPLGSRSGVSGRMIKTFYNRYFGERGPPKGYPQYDHDWPEARRWSQIAWTKSMSFPLQWQWGDFTDAAAEKQNPAPLPMALPKGKEDEADRWIFSKKLTAEWMKANNVATIFRGHQHTGSFLQGMNE